VTSDAVPRFGPLGRRLLAAFAVVALVSVTILTVAALVGTDQGLTAARRSERQHAANRAAAAAATAYAAAGGWTGADLRPAQAVADGVGAELVVRDSTAAMMWPGHAPARAGPGHGSQSTASTTVSAPVLVGGQSVGSVSLIFGTATTTGRGVAWTWVAAAAGVALAVALAVSGFVSRQLTGPLVAVTRTARAFAGGDRSARSRIRAPGELGELAAAFNSMAEEVVHTEQVRRRLAADVAHELRTPLAALQAGLEELRDGLADPTPARIGSLHDQALRLGRVVDDLAQLSAAESAALSLRLANADLAAIVAAALDSQEPRLRAAGLVVRRDIATAVPVRADADRLHQAIVNLLTNTARYCRPDDQVAVGVAVADGQGLVRVADTGPGIDPDDLPYLFERLWRGRTSTSVAGSGIGLAVVRELITAHGGTVAVQSEPGMGATFTIRLPLAESLGSQPLQPSEGEVGQSRA
jgi:two-component system sensor histidine kinase BaeS